MFLCAVAIGFLIELSTYETLNFAEIRQALIRLPHKWNQLHLQKNNVPSYLKTAEEGLEEQFENETVIIEHVSTPMGTITFRKKKRLKFWEEPTLLKANFTWLVNNESTCKRSVNDSPDLRIMPVLVHTARSHFEERLAIRRSWGSLPIYRKWDIRFVFLLGEADRGPQAKLNQEQFEEQELKLANEQKEFGDLVVGSFIDTYHNLTRKHLMGYKWVLNFCREATFVLKIDDDMFIDIMTWLDWRSDELDALERNKTANIYDLYCHTFGGTQPIRDEGNKWYVSPEDWPDPDYPDYCSGWAYGATVDLIQKIYTSSNDRKMLWVDDVFVTGALLDDAIRRYNFNPKIKHIWGEVTTDIEEYRPMCDRGSLGDKRDFKAVVYVPRGELMERDMMCMWNKTLHDHKLGIAYKNSD